jgi:Mor family transcriptional regulator
MDKDSSDRNAKIYARRSGGLTLAAISREFQLSIETVREIARRMERKAKWRAAQLRGEEPPVAAPSVGIVGGRH